MRSFYLGLAAGVALATMSLSAHSAEKAEKSAAQPSAAAAMRVYVDPETKTLVDRPVTPEQKAVAEQTDAAFSQSSDGLQQVVHADGSVSMDLQGRFELATTATRAADGSLATDCVDAAHAAAGTHTHAADGKAVPAPVSQRDDR